MSGSWRPASPQLVAHIHPPSTALSIAPTLLSSASLSPVRRQTRILTWIFSLLLVAGLLIYVVYQLYHITLAASLDHYYSYRRLHAQYTNTPLNTPPLTPHTATTTTATATTTTPYTPHIALVVLGDTTAATRYSQHWSSLACYAHRHNYTFLTHSNDKTTHPHPCHSYDNFFFRKHCTVAQLLLAHPHVDWWLVLDGDVFVVNGELTVQRWLSHPLADPHSVGADVVVHYERFHNGEIMAGNYIVGNTQRGVDYLMGWAGWQHSLPSHAFHNHDNGALQLHLLSYMVGKDSDDYKHVLSMYGALHNWAEYDAYVGAFRCVIGGSRVWSDAGIRIVRRGHFMVRDFFVSSEVDRIAEVTNIGVVGGGEVMLHGWKEAIVGVWWAEPIDTAKCMSEKDWTPRLVDSVRVDMAELMRVVRERERYTVTDRSNSVAMTDVSDCFPRCPAELTAAQAKTVRQRLCPPALKEKYVKGASAAAAGAS